MAFDLRKKGALVLGGGPIFSLCTILFVLLAAYWMLFASDRYVSEAKVVVQTSEISLPSLNLSTMLTGKTSGGGDLVLLKEYLRSTDLLHVLDNELALRKHFSDSEIDIVSRLYDENTPFERFHEYFLNRVDVHIDDHSGVLRIRVSAYDRKMAAAIANAMIKYGEQRINLMSQNLAGEQVNFIEKQVVQLAENLDKARNVMIAYQNKTGLISPTGTTESLAKVVAGLEAQLSSFQVKRGSMLNYLNSSAPEIKQVDSQIAALRRQIDFENGKLTASRGNALNRVTADFETLKLRAKFAQELYSNAMSTLEATRVQSARNLKKVAVLQTPTLPEYSEEPHRLYNTVASALLLLMFGMIIHMLLLIIKDHRD